MLPADVLLTHMNDIDECVRVLRESVLIPNVTTDIYEYQNIVLVQGSDDSIDRVPTLFVVKNCSGGKFMPFVNVWKSTESIRLPIQNSTHAKNDLIRMAPWLSSSLTEHE